MRILSSNFKSGVRTFKKALKAFVLVKPLIYLCVCIYCSTLSQGEFGSPVAVGGGVGRLEASLHYEIL